METSGLRTTSTQPDYHNITTYLQELLDSAPDAIIVVNAHGEIVLASMQVTPLFGYQRDELLGQSVDLLLPDELRGRHAQHRATYIAAPRTRPMGTDLHLGARRKDGTTFPVEISLSATQTPAGLLVMSVIRDVSERAAFTAELERLVEQRTAHVDTLVSFSQALLAAPDTETVLQLALQQAMQLAPQVQVGSVYLHDPSDDMLVVRADTRRDQPNAVGTRWSPYGTPVGIMLAKHQSMVLHSQHDILTQLEQFASYDVDATLDRAEVSALPTGAVLLSLNVHDQSIGVLALLRLAGEGVLADLPLRTLTTLANLTAIALVERQRQVQVAHLEAQHRSMTERVSAVEAAMLQAARMAAIGQLSASIAHEINNPLYAARNGLYLLEQDLPEEHRSSRFLALARQELGRIAGIIERMREFYRPHLSTFQMCQLNLILEDTLALVQLDARYKAISVVCSPDASLPAVPGNVDQLRQVFLNLTMNALEAMPNGGTLTIFTTFNARFVTVAVCDTGIGIPNDVRERLFEPFFTNKQNGTGLGLSISAHIVTQHGGHISVESHEGAGSTFYVVLPRQTEEDG